MDKLMRYFTDASRRALKLAQQEAERLHHVQIGTEHLLLGLLREGEGVASRVLRDLGLQSGDVQHWVERLSTMRRRSLLFNSELDLTPRTKRVLELAGDEAKRKGNSRIDTHHLLLGLVRQGDGTAVEVLNHLGVTSNQIRRTTSRMLQRQPVLAGKPDHKGKKKRQSARTPVIDKLAIDLTSLAEQNKLDPVVGREQEIERVIQILARRTKNNPALIGEPGVGKTAIVEGLAQRIVAGAMPGPLLDKRVLQLDVGSLVAGTIYRGQFEERLKRVISELKDSSSILFIDEVHMLVGAGSAGSSVDAANILKPALARGELQCIGATTLKEYRRYIESDAALERRFQPVTVDEPSVEETLEILRGVRSAYEQHHKLRIGDEALEVAVRLSARYISDRYLPDKAIDVIDESASRVRMYKAPQARSLRELFAQLKVVQKAKDEAIKDHRYEDAAVLRDQEIDLQERLEALRTDWDNGNVVVSPEDVAEVVSMWTGIPLTQLRSGETERLLHMEEGLHQRIVGQDEAITAVAKAVRRARAGLKDPCRPIGSFIFLGPTGVGKTELVKALAEFMFGSEDALVQLDMSEFMERHSVARLVGAPPGYIGYDDAGQLTEAVRRRPFSVVVFDEVEKAHPETYNMLLQIMEEGHLSDARGHKVDFRNTIIVMTSNIGADLIKRETSLGFAVPRHEQDEESRARRDYEEMRKKLLEELKRVFRPEFLNRVDNVIVFHALSQEEIARIVDLELDKVRTRLVEYDIGLEVTAGASELLAEEGYSEEYGARPLRRVIQNRIEDTISDAILAGTFEAGDTILAEAAEGEIALCQANGAMEPVPA
jgi:ATP-dependent Clp protease ATP-binding subunit ClpC